MDWKERNKKLIESKNFQKVKNVEIINLFKTNDDKLINFKTKFENIKCEYPDVFNIDENIELIAKGEFGIPFIKVEDWEFYSTIQDLELLAVIGSSYEYINSTVGYDYAAIVKFYKKC